MKDQNRKSHLAQFGEFSVAAELHRRQFTASVTYGNQKSMDIIALSKYRHYAIIEVKTSEKDKFLTGLTPKELNEDIENKFWVFVKTQLETPHPETAFYVLTHEEIKSTQTKRNQKYSKEYKERNGKDFEGKGVPAVILEDIISHRDQWRKIERYLSEEKVYPCS